MPTARRRDTRTGRSGRPASRFDVPESSPVDGMRWRRRVALTPRRASTGRTDRRSSVSRAGDRRARPYRPADRRRRRPPSRATPIRGPGRRETRRVRAGPRPPPRGRPRGTPVSAPCRRPARPRCRRRTRRRGSPRPSRRTPPRSGARSSPSPRRPSGRVPATSRTVADR